MKYFSFELYYEQMFDFFRDCFEFDIPIGYKFSDDLYSYYLIIGCDSKNSALLKLKYQFDIIEGNIELELIKIYKMVFPDYVTKNEYCSHSTQYQQLTTGLETFIAVTSSCSFPYYNRTNIQLILDTNATFDQVEFLN